MCLGVYVCAYHRAGTRNGAASFSLLLSSTCHRSLTTPPVTNCARRRRDESSHGCRTVRIVGRVVGRSSSKRNSGAGSSKEVFDALSNASGEMRGKSGMNDKRL